MSKRVASTVLPVTSPKLSTASDTSLRDYLPGDRRDLPGVAETPGQVSASKSFTVDDDFDIQVVLPELLGFPREFIKDLESVGGQPAIGCQIIAKPSF